MLGLETTFMDRPPRPDDPATIGLIDTAEGNAWQPLARTVAWNWQQGAMLQWLPSAPHRLIVYNARQEGRFVSVVRDIFTGEERVLPRPVYALSPDGTSALSTNFARIADTRPGYGYVGFEDPGRDDGHPDDDGIYRMDLETGEHGLIISYAQVARFRRDPSMEEAKHWFNHVQVNTDGSRFAFLHRWAPFGQARPWKTRLFTANFDGSDLYCVADHGMVSHYDWRGRAHILAWARQEGIGDRFFLFTDRSDQRETVGERILTTDGHCSWSPERHGLPLQDGRAPAVNAVANARPGAKTGRACRRWILTDTYPDEERMRTLILYCVEDNKRVDVGRFFAPEELDGEIRCDLHPRWRRDGLKVSFDSAHEGTRQMYVIDVSDIVGHE